MTPLPQPNDPTDRNEFETTLTRLVSNAASNGVDVEGAYDVPTRRVDRTDYTVEITEVETRFSSDDGGGDSDGDE